MSRRTSPLLSASPGFLEAMWARFCADPASVDESWQCLFGVLDQVGDATGTDMLGALHVNAADIIRARGHLLARLDPLSPGPVAGPDTLAGHAVPASASDEDLAARYMGSLSVETAHIDDPNRRRWLLDAFEAAPEPPTRENQVGLLHDLIRADEFERFLGRKFPTKKRFGAEGAEAVVPLLREVLRRAAAAGVTHAVIGTMHRGRLVLGTEVVGRSLVQLLAEIKGAHPFPADPARPGDVPYHLGHRGTVDTPSGPVAVIMLSNPSHLEAVDPVVLGAARAMQDELGTARVLPIILHTDAAVVAQGVVAECLQLSGVPGFSTGGTVHLVINNQIGFTTETAEARTSRHCTGPWKAIDSCILHVNGDDPLAVIRAGRLAVDWRQAQGCDAVVDLVCFRRNGHNEIDEPTFTQPVLYRAVANQVPVAEATARRMVAAGLVTSAEVAGFAETCRARLGAAYEASGEHRGNATGFPPHAVRTPRETGVAPGRLRAVAAHLAASPPNAALHPKMERLLRQRDPGDGPVTWPVAESLAFGTLLQDGVAVRLTGQDVQRGAFSHRHYAVTDTATGARHVALASVPGARASLAIHNSPLSEYAVLGFEYGYSLEAPDALTLWEAQFGDFANGAQIVIDQFIAAGEEKWCTPSGLVLLLPHGLEGQGPEHSSARIERFLQLAAGDAMRIANPSTPANYFHLLRRQVLGSARRPLVVFGAKRLLRLPAAVSPQGEFAPGTAFRPVIADVPEGAALILLCNGKIAYDLLAERDRIGATGVGIVRLEELYPFPAEALRAALAGHAGVPCRWVQEEPRNMGAWSWLDRRLEALIGAAVGYVGRNEAGSPAGSFHGDHDDDQARIVGAAFD